MRRIIDGITYNSDTALAVASHGDGKIIGAYPSRRRGKLIDVPTESFAGRTTVDTGWPTTPVVSTFGITTSGTKLGKSVYAGRDWRQRLVNDAVKFLTKLGK